MATLSNHLEISRCPHCNVDSPSLPTVTGIETRNHKGANQRYWRMYACSRCGGIVTASAKASDASIIDMFPTPQSVDPAIPNTAGAYLQQALQSIHAPAGAVMLAASAVDAMLKEKGLKEGVLYNRINQAAKSHLITEDMAKWAHEVRLDANDQRHADEGASLPDEGDARRVVDFAIALGQFLFVLPSRVKRGLADASGAHKPA